MCEASNHVKPYGIQFIYSIHLFHRENAATASRHPGRDPSALQRFQGHELVRPGKIPQTPHVGLAHRGGVKGEGEASDLLLDVIGQDLRVNQIMRSGG